MLRYVLIAEDHPICFAALEIAIHSRDSAIFVESCDTLAGALEQLSLRDYSALLLDLGLKDSEGIINLKTIRYRYRDIPILIVSATDDIAIQQRAREFGAQGYLSKKASLGKMSDAIEAIMDGKTSFEFNSPSANTEPDLLRSFTPAQINVIKELLRGNSNKIIAYNLNISESTVKSHLNKIFSIFGVNNRTQVLLKYKEIL